ncbi:head completion/stabilization protein [Pseudomonas veronii]|uniref:head completion/stabilization protein n=1 Tax=Pseudomonas veronii TaxID=76761 RepID=UPI001E46764D|nr:head completion/stabilization protein [Pseudomonas veronii]
MSGFVASGPVASGHINTDVFWPSIDLDELRATLRIDASVTAPRLETAAVAAAISVNRELSGWRAIQQAAGHVELADVPSEKINNVSVLVHLYRRAIEAARPCGAASNSGSSPSVTRTGASTSRESSATCGGNKAE